MGFNDLIKHIYYMFINIYLNLYILRVNDCYSFSDYKYDENADFTHVYARSF